MSRAIQLSKIHALNWYGYRDSLPVNGNLLLAGLTGSGKSILMDLLMLVLVGPERARHHFNRSATGSKSDRTIKGYCLLDTKREINGQPQYFHDKGVTTVIAAEFTWPDGQRVETWGLRFEFRNTTENDGVTTPFFCPGSLDRADFLSVSPDDGMQRMRGQGEFKNLVDSKNGRIFPTAKEYARDMANPSHLNFNREVLDRLLPSAMSFTNLKSFDDFCRQFVLPAEAVPVEDVASSYRDFKSYESELRDLRGQLDQLLAIRDLTSKHKNAERDHKVASYLAAELAWQHAQADADATESRLEQLQATFAADEQRLKVLGTLNADASQKRDEYLSVLNESEEGRLYKSLADRADKLQSEIAALRAQDETIGINIGERVKSARDWLTDMENAPVQPPLDAGRMTAALAALDSCGKAETTPCLKSLAQASEQLSQQLRDRFRDDADKLLQLRAEKTAVDSQIHSLGQGLPPVPQPLLHALRAQLPTLPGETPPQALRELCELDDEAWRQAVEVAFEEKFAVLISPAHHAQALEILASLPPKELQEAAPQRLVNGEKESAPGHRKNTLAALIRCSSPEVRAYVDGLFGQTVLATSLTDFARHDSAVMPDGMLKRGAAVTRPRPYDGLPFLGERGLKAQLKIKHARLEEITAALRRLEPMERQVKRLLSSREFHIPDHSDIVRDLTRLEELPNKEKELADTESKLHAIANDKLSDLTARITEIKTQIGLWDQEKTAILQKGNHNEINRVELHLAKLRETASRDETEFLRVRSQIDVSPFSDRYESWRSEVAESLPALDARAREFSKAARNAEVRGSEILGDLRFAMLGFKNSFSPKFDDLPHDGSDTVPYENLLSRIEGANIPDYEKKSSKERKRWESLFRTQVLSRMQQALKNVENIIALLNQLLKRPIGHDRYKIDRKLNPEYRAYRTLIDLNSLHHEDELFFANMDADLKAALEQFLSTLEKNANSPEAERLLDYRQYFDYDLLVSDIRNPDDKPVSVDKQSGKMSGGENQSPYFVAILASYLHAYNRHETRRKAPSLALVPIDEAFSKLSGERILNCIEAMAELDLQGMFSMSSGNIPYAFSQCDQLIVVTRKEERRGARVGVRNVPSIVFRDSPEGKTWIEGHAS